MRPAIDPKIVKARESLLKSVEECVEREGFCETTYTNRLDDDCDPLKHSIEVMVAGLLARGGDPRFPAEPKTLQGELKALAERRGWDFQISNQFGDWVIVAPIKEWECPSCQGIGRIREPIKMTRIDFEKIDPRGMVERVFLCGQCETTGKVYSRVAPQVSWLNPAYWEHVRREAWIRRSLGVMGVYEHTIH